MPTKINLSFDELLKAGLNIPPQPAPRPKKRPAGKAKAQAGKIGDMSTHYRDLGGESINAALAHINVEIEEEERQRRSRPLLKRAHNRITQVVVKVLQDLGIMRQPLLR